MSFSYERYDRQQRRGFSGPSTNRTAFGYWVPLIITVTAATAGVAAWIWNERTTDEDDVDAYYYGEYNRSGREGGYPPGAPPPPGEEGIEGSWEDIKDAPPGYRDQPGMGEASYGTTMSASGRGSSGEKMDVYGPGFPAPPPGRIAMEDLDPGTEGDGFMAQIVRRTPSPQQLFDGASKRFNAGMAAVGKSLSSITEERSDAFSDHERWSEEAESRERSDREGDESYMMSGASGAGIAAAATTAAAAVGSAVRGGESKSSHASKSRSAGKQDPPKRTVAVVVSAASDEDEESSAGTFQVGHASILSHLIGHANSPATRLLVLIYAPHLKQHPLSTANPNQDPEQASSSHIPETPHDSESRIISSYDDPTSSEKHPELYKALTTQAASLVAHPTHILPFTTPNGHVSMLRHLAPSIVYVQESLSSSDSNANGDGENAAAVEGWVGQVVVVVGAEGPGAGLVDTETEDEGVTDEEGRRSKTPDQRRGRGRGRKWWMDETRVGLGKGVDMVEGMRVGEDWEKRVNMR
ncbi:MAG: hypothetical protein M1831_005945 [Alyxoria varia]|nr:MAG: hypothetical protein M1831_005945 [Alyxoria varia]